jgi:hypothetical protein
MMKVRCLQCMQVTKDPATGHCSTCSGAPVDGHRDGKTYDPALDYARLNTQMKRVWSVIADKQWHSLAGISSRTGDPEASVSARIRDLRKQKFGSHVIEERRVTQGLHEYRLLN